MLILVRYGVAPGDDPELPPRRERAEWIPLPENTPDPRAVQIAGYPGKWLLQSSVELLVDWGSQHTQAKYNRFGELIQQGGQLLPGGTQDIYRLPLLPGYQIVDEDTYVSAWNRVCAPGQEIPEEN